MHCKSLWIKASAKCINVKCESVPWDTRLGLHMHIGWSTLFDHKKHNLLSDLFGDFKYEM